jgi:hypothetical protein
VASLPVEAHCLGSLNVVAELPSFFSTERASTSVKTHSVNPRHVSMKKKTRMPNFPEPLTFSS